VHETKCERLAGFVAPIYHNPDTHNCPLKDYECLSRTVVRAKVQGSIISCHSLTWASYYVYA